MELSSEVLLSLEAIASSAVLSDDVFKTLLCTSLKSILDPATEQAVTTVGENEAMCKETVFALATLLLELARIDADPTTLRYSSLVCGRLCMYYTLCTQLFVGGAQNGPQ